jgi:C-terminal processing protease CtpA/Prc
MWRSVFFGLLVLMAGFPAADGQMILRQNQIGVPVFNLGSAGIGAVLITRDGAPVISQVIAHGPAAGAGLRAQDTIVWVNYRDVAGMKLDEVVSLIRGPSGSSVAVTVLHPGDPKPHTFTMARAPIVIGGP